MYQCRSSKSQAIEEWEVSLCELNAFIALLYVRAAYGGENFPFTIFEMKNGAYHFFNKPCQEIVVVKLYVFYGSTYVAQSQHAGKPTNLLLFQIFGL